MTTLTVGTNDQADNTGDLIVTFVDASPPGVTTDGTRTALPGAPWGCYLVAPSISPQPGCVVTLSPTTAQWESFSLIWQPPPHAAVIWTAGGAFSGAGSAAANPKFPPQTFSGAGETDATAGISGQARVQAALGASVGASAGVSGQLRVRSALGATAAGAGGIKGVASGPGATAWQEAGIVNSTAAVSSRIRLGVAAGGLTAAAAGISGNAARSAQQWLVSGEIDGSGSISSNPAIGHQYFVAAKPAAVGGVIPFAGNAPLRVTNYVRNPRPEMNQGASTLPVEWFSFDASNELTMTIIGEGTESGIPYLDFQFSVAAGAGGETYFQTEQFVMTGPGSVWSYSQFLRLVGGSLTNITKVALFMYSGDSATGSGITPHIGSAITPTSAALSSQSSSFSVLINDTGMDSFATGYYLLHAAGAVNLTLRVGGAKAEKLPASTGSQFLVVPQVGFVPSLGGTTSFVY